YTVNPTAIGLCLEKPVTVKLEHGQKEPTRTHLKLVRGATLSVKVPAELAGQSIQWLDAEKFTRPEGVFEGWYVGGELADGEGRMEQWNTRPAEYTLAYSPPSGSGYSGAEVSPTIVLGRARASKVVSAAKAGSIEAALLTPPPATAKAKFKLERAPVEIDPRLGQRGWYLQQAIVLQGERAVASHYYYWNQTDVVVAGVIGTPPPDLRLADPGSVSFGSLPAGEYKVHCVTQWTNYWAQNKEIKKELLKSFSVKDGEVVDLGPLKAPAPPPPPEAATQPWVEDSIESDLDAPKFQP
ncbi:MAG TPA: hypothetical protein VEJ63_10195, partial [Planctomycetota bacterium]|nr:hypothetical protein [Planctomycetota bacterium]